MMQTATLTPEPQRLRALERANEVRLARAELKRRIADAQTSAAEVILTAPSEASSWTVGDLLTSQRRWGRTRCQKFLTRNQISEVKTIGALTDRQRRMLAAQLECAEAVAEIRARMDGAVAERACTDSAEALGTESANVVCTEREEVETSAREDYALVGLA